MRGLFIGFLFIAGLVIGGAVVANVAYQVGVTTAVNVATASAPDGAVVTPVVPGAYPYGYGYGYGPGWGHGGFGIFGILAGLFFLFLFFGLIRAAFWRGGGGRGWGGPGAWGGPGGPGGPGRWGEHDPRNRFHETFEDWHRQAHGEPSPPKDPPA